MRDDGRMRGRRIWIVVTIATVASVILVATIVSQQFAGRRDAGIQPSPSPAASGTLTPGPSLSASPLPPGTFENAILGYRITMPVGYRRASSRIITGQDTLGQDFYTLATEADERAACLRDLGDVPERLEGDPPLVVQVARNVRGLSALELATASHLSTHHKLEQTTIGGREAVRFVSDNAAATTDGFVISANDRVYEMYPPQGPPPKTWLDAIARTFVVIQPSVFPSPTATTAPRVAAADLAEALRTAFAAKDADAVAKLMSPCRIGVSSVIEPVQPGLGGCCIINRSTALFTQALKDRFAKGDLTMTVDPSVQVKTDTGGDLYFVRSEWREPDRTTPVDLFLRELDGRWVWTEALHHWQRAVVGSCVPYRSPWTSATGSC